MHVFGLLLLHPLVFWYFTGVGFELKQLNTSMTERVICDPGAEIENIFGFRKTEFLLYT